MRIKILPVVIALIFLSGLSVNWTHAQIVDLSIDDVVIAEMQKRVDLKNSELAKGDEKLAAKQRAANRLEAKDICIKCLKESAKVIVIGFFAFDTGCRFDGAFVDMRYFERGDTEFSKNALAALGWEKADRPQRETLAKVWIEEGLLAFSVTPYRSISAVTSSGEIRVTVFLQRPAGITSRSVPKRFVFDISGNLNSADDY